MLFTVLVIVFVSCWADVSAKSMPGSKPQIVDGANTDITANRYSCFVVENNILACGCVLVSANRVLSVQGCLVQSTWDVVLGLSTLSNIVAEVTAGTAQLIGISSITGHPDFNAADIAEPANQIIIIDLDSDALLTNTVEPIDRLALPFEKFTYNDECTIIGLGATVMAQTPTFPDIVQIADISIIKNKECAKLLELDTTLSKNVICGYNGDTAGSVCLSDYGGGLVCRKNDKTVLAGVIFNPTSTCTGLAVCIRVSYYWIFLLTNL